MVHHVDLVALQRLRQEDHSWSPAWATEEELAWERAWKGGLEEKRVLPGKPTWSQKPDPSLRQHGLLKSPFPCCLSSLSSAIPQNSPAYEEEPGGWLTQLPHLIQGEAQPRLWSG